MKSGETEEDTTLSKKNLQQDKIQFWCKYDDEGKS